MKTEDVFGEGERVTVDGEPGTIIDSPMRDAYVIELDTGETVQRMSNTIRRPDDKTEII